MASAFPNSSQGGSIQAGLTKREYFAALALQGLLSGPKNESPGTAAARAVQCADALIDALGKSGESSEPFQGPLGRTK